MSFCGVAVMSRLITDLEIEFAERLRFEGLWTDLSARGVGVTVETIDNEIVNAQRQTVEALDRRRADRPPSCELPLESVGTTLLPLVFTDESSFVIFFVRRPRSFQQHLLHLPIALHGKRLGYHLLSGWLCRNRKLALFVWLSKTNQAQQYTGARPGSALRPKWEIGGQCASSFESPLRRRRLA